MRCYGWTLDYVDCEIPSCQSWAFYNWSLENELTLDGPVAVRAGLGYIGTEREAILARMKGT